MSDQDGYRRANRWRLRSVDPEVSIRIDGDQPIEGGLARTQAPSITTGATTGARQPTVRWNHGGLPVYTFATQLVARDDAHNLWPTLDGLRALQQRDGTLGRAPLVRLTWGGESVQGFVKVDDRISHYLPNGLPRLVDLEITITEVASGSRSAASGGAGETLYRVLRPGETLELLAWRMTGDPLRGEVLRRVNPQLSQRREVPGDVVKVLEADHPAMLEPIRPVAPCFQGEDWPDELGELGRLRGSSSSPSTPWALLRAQLGLG